MRTGTLVIIAVVLLAVTVTTARPAQAAVTTISCTPVESMTYGIRIHVRCDRAVGGILFFALGTADEAAAARAFSVINTALVAGRALNIQYDPADTSGTAIGCLATDCRLIQAIGMK